MNQNYNTPMFICTLPGDDAILPNPVKNAFKAAYPTFNEALKWAMSGGRCILKLVSTDSIVYDFDAITIKNAQPDSYNPGIGSIVLMLKTINPDQSTS